MPLTVKIVDLPPCRIILFFALVCKQVRKKFGRKRVELHDSALGCKVD